MTTPLYTLEILRLAASVADRPRLDNPDATVERRSPTCGSWVTVDVTLDAKGRVALFGQTVRACALGQASAVLLANHVIGRDGPAMAQAASALRAYLSGARDDPGDWPGLEVFLPARVHSARHASILLAFDAAAAAAIQAAS